MINPLEAIRPKGDNRELDKFEHYAANVIYALMLRGFRVENGEGCVMLTHDGAELGSAATIHDLLSSLICDAAYLRLREQTLKLVDEEGNNG